MKLSSALLIISACVVAAYGQLELLSSGIEFLKDGVTNAGELAKGVGGHLVDSAVLVQRSSLDTVASAAQRIKAPSARSSVVQASPKPSDSKL